MINTKDDNYPTELFRFIRNAFKIGGIWMPNVKKYNMYKCYFYFNVIGVNIFTLLQFISLKETFKDMEALGKNLSMCLQHGFGVIKLYIWLTNYEKLIHIMGLLENSEYRYESCDDFQPVKIIKQYQKSVMWVVKAYFGLAASIGISGCCVALLNVTMDPNYLQPIKGIYGEKLPYYMWSPLDVTNSKLTFICLVFYEWYNLFAYGQIISACDTNSFTILHFITLHTALVQGAFRTIRQRALNKIDIDETDPLFRNVFDRQVNIEIKKCINHTWYLLRISADAEQIYNKSTFVQYMITLIMSCNTLYLVSTISLKNPVMISALVYLSALYYQISTLSWIGNEYTLNWEQISDAIYESEWYLLPTKISKSLLFIKARFRKPIYISIGKFAPLGVTSLCVVIRLSYSTFNLLRQNHDIEETNQ